MLHTKLNIFQLIITLALPFVSLADDVFHIIPPPDAKVITVIPSETPRTDSIIRLKIISFNDFHG
ncbi:MAG: hypothetical protein LBU65_13735 [Planctomycetaceae bacterium]|jgi:hypothetical protein|nr:hypothetical protein [Planctomycetaceae bacterium]